MIAVLVNYNFKPAWLKYIKCGLEPIIFDRSDDGKSRKIGYYAKVYKTQNIGNVDYDKLTYLVDNYDDLPDIFIWGKTNLFKYISREEFLEEMKTPCFKPLLTQHHKVYAPVCYYKDGMYYERNDSWYLHQFESKFKDWSAWAQEFNLPNPQYIPFPPGGNFMLTKEKVHKYPKEFYDKMRNTLNYTQLPGEAQLAERSYYLLWND